MSCYRKGTPPARPSGDARRYALEACVWESGLQPQWARAKTLMRNSCQGGGFDDVVRYLDRNQGKHLRALMVLASAASPDDRDVDVAAASIELLENASLMHDDIVDRSSERRGAPSVPQEFGPRDALLAGNFVVGRSLRMLGAAAARKSVPLPLGDLRQLAAGQLCERAPTPLDLDAARRRYLWVARWKTGALMIFGCTVGARFAGASPETERLVRDVAHRVALAYQVLDDARDLEGPESLGKAPGGDLASGTVTWPMLEWAGAQSLPADALRALHLTANPERREALRRRIVSEGGGEQARRFARETLDDGRRLVERLPAPASRAVFGALLDFIEGM